jgi:hypothetical protein
MVDAGMSAKPDGIYAVRMVVATLTLMINAMGEFHSSQNYQD